MSATKTFRHGQILRLISGGHIANQEELRHRLAQQKLRVTQATLSRDLQELKLVKTNEGYKSGSGLPEEAAHYSPAYPRTPRIPAGHPARAESPGPQNASQWRAAPCCCRRRRKISRNCRYRCRR